MIGEPTVVGQTIAGTGSSALPRKLWTDQEPTSSAYSYLLSLYLSPLTSPLTGRMRTLKSPDFDFP